MTVTSNRLLIGMGFATIAAFLWALTLETTAFLPPSLPTIEIVTARYGVQLLLLVLFVLPFRQSALVRTAKPWLQGLRGFMMFVMPVAFAVAASRLGVTDSWAALWIAPALGIVCGNYLLGESQPTKAFALVIVATIGAILAHAPTRSFSITGIVAVAVAAASFGAFLALTRALRSDSTSTGLFWTASCVFVPALLLLPHVWQPLGLRAIAALAAMGALWLLVLWCIDEALRRAPLGFAAPFLLTEVVWVRLLFHSPWTRTAEVGAGAIVACAGWCIRAALVARDTAAISATLVG